MLELKIISGVARMYRGTLRLALHSLNERDKRALKKYERSLKVAESYRNLARECANEALTVEGKANHTYDGKCRKVTTAYNYIQNLQEDFEAKA